MVNIPIVTLDKIYIKPDEENIYFLDCTRVDKTNKIIARKSESLEEQLKRLGIFLKDKKIILADDVVYSGSVLKNIINRFSNLGIEVVGVISSIAKESSYNYFQENLKFGIRCNYLMSDLVIDQICERDFYFGIAGSGIMIDTKNGLFKAPYFKPFGDVCARASIPEYYEKKFSISCLERSIYLWQEIDKLKNKFTLIKELPEKIINTNDEDEVVKVLKREVKKL